MTTLIREDMRRHYISTTEYRGVSVETYAVFMPVKVRKRTSKKHPSLFESRFSHCVAYARLPNHGWSEDDVSGLSYVEGDICGVDSAHGWPGRGDGSQWAACLHVSDALNLMENVINAYKEKVGE